MVFVTNLKWLSFKQDLSSVDRMLEDQVSTYAILRYSFEIPDRVYKIAMDQLTTCIEEIYYRKLHKLVSLYNNVSSAGLKDFEDEYVETVEIRRGYDNQGMIIAPADDGEVFGLEFDIEDGVFTELE